MEIALFYCFCHDMKGSGNVAGVADASTTSIEAIQQVAKALKLPVLVMVDKATMRVRFFYPGAEMTYCMHGTLAAIAWLAVDGQVTLQTHDNRCIQAERSGDTIQIATSLVSLSAQTVNHEIISLLLNALPEIVHADYYCGVASVGSPKLLTPVVSLSILKDLNPNIEAIKDYSQKNGVNGLYVYTPETLSSNANFHARAFNPQTGNNEDAATGIAAAALAGSLKRSLCIEQGYFIQQPSLIHVEYKSDDDIRIGGKVKFFKTLMT